MTDSIRSIFEHNIRLLGNTDKAVYFFRKQQYDKALRIVADSIDQIKYVVEAIITDRSYFNLVATESVLEMLTGILEAKKKGDFILLADLLELQLVSFLCNVQELIISKEEITFEEKKYLENIKALMDKGEGFQEQMKETINPGKLLESGYSVEFTSSGLMTLAAEQEGAKFYFHTNSRVLMEAFLLAREWYQEETQTYILYGMGMGYHVQELHDLAPKAKIEVYEADYSVIQLTSAFTDAKELFTSDYIRIFYDPELMRLKKRIFDLPEDEVFVAHYPSLRNIRNDVAKKIMEKIFPWSKTIESC